MTTRVKDLEPRLKQSEQHVKELTTISDSLRNELAAKLQNLNGVIQKQQETITALTEQVARLTAENSALRDTLDNMSTVVNTVYYVVGTKDELEKKGVIQEEGGARFLFVLWKSGKTLVPSRHLDPAVFTSVDRRHLPALPLTADNEYHVVSRRPLSALQTRPDPDGTLARGASTSLGSTPFLSNSHYFI